MAYRVAREAPDLVDGITAISANLPVEDNFDCTSSGQPVSVTVMNSTEDPKTPHEGGLVEYMGAASRGDVRSSIATARYWASLAGADLEPEFRQPELDEDPETNVQLETWRGRDDLTINLYTLHGSDR
jgi:polyhydroxybutyrate depolymerase